MYYYGPPHDLKAAVGFVIEPLYKDEQASSVEIAVFSEHRSRAAAMNASAFATVCERVVMTLLRHRSNWTRVSLAVDDFRGLCASEAFRRDLKAAGFAPTDADPCVLVRVASAAQQTRSWWSRFWKTRRGDP